jgi:cytochrome c biogenesis protein CcmG, thiol:disulfide interchange protein DsbE
MERRTTASLTRKLATVYFMRPSSPFFPRLGHLVLVWTIALVITSCTTSMPPSTPHHLLGQKGPAFDAVSLDNQPILFPAFGGSRVTVLDFWASWCGSCQVTMPSLERLHRDRRRDGLTVVGISVDETAEQALDGAYRFGVTFPVVHDRGQELQSVFGVNQVPTTFVLDDTGRVRFVGSDPESIKRAVSALMGR